MEMRVWDGSNRAGSVLAGASICSVGDACGVLVQPAKTAIIIMISIGRFMLTPVTINRTMPYHNSVRPAGHHSPELTEKSPAQVLRFIGSGRDYR